jgi:hypothetical protein
MTSDPSEVATAWRSASHASIALKELRAALVGCPVLKSPITQTN